MEVRTYNSRTDYEAVEALYKDSSTFGGQYDDARDTSERLAVKPDSILVAEVDEKIVGTVTMFEDGRAAWLYRFAVADGNAEIAQALSKKALQLLKEKGHTQVLVYAPAGDTGFEGRYSALGFNKGNDYTAYWQDI